MAISVAGLTFYRPIVSVSTEYNTDGSNNTVGIADSVSITDTVLVTDTIGLDLTAIYNSALDLAMNPAALNISYPGNSNTRAYIQGVSASNDSDFATKLIYTLTFKATPTRNFSSLYPGVVGRNVQSISYSQSIDIPHDLSSVVLPIANSESTEGEEAVTTGIFYNKPCSYTVAISVQCGSTQTTTAFQNADSVACGLFTSQPSGDFLPSGFGTGVSPYSFSRTVDHGAGNININYVGYFMPSGAYGMYTAEQSATELVNKIDNYTDKTYQLNVTKIPILKGVSCAGSEPTEGLSSDARTIVQGVLDKFIEVSGVTGVTVAQPGGTITQPCILTLPTFTNSGCDKVKNVTIEEQKGNNSASLAVELSNQNVGYCITGDYISNYSIIRKPRKDQKTIVEVQGWSSSGYWVQNMNVSPDTVYEYTIDVTAKRSCVTGTGIIGEATGIFGKIDYMNGSGIITNKVISVNDNKCSLKITQYSGVDQSTSGVGYEVPEL